MKHLRHLLIAVVVPTLILTLFVVGSTLAGGPQGKTDLCHLASHKYVEINVSTNAVAAHMNHGDVAPDEYGDCP